ncbi:hypothetical protein PLANPX_1912 [Lacipirellula parvula]|uniref:Uncharacterized protein n=1 Tax=Lacipirellula parvula TaxID=2650471 RepID=A0A5K7X6T6_9BACT|nr:hypothetical protein PLANPX_1912 [Lacipirellula parvula]
MSTPAIDTESMSTIGAAWETGTFKYVPNTHTWLIQLVSLVGLRARRTLT